MYRDILINKWVLGGIGFLIVLTVACVLWYQHDTADDRKAAAEAEELLRQSEAAKKTSDTDSEMEQAADLASAESTTPTAEKPIIEVTAEGVEKNTSPNESSATLTQQTQETDEKVRVSPHGFGPYPEVPEDYPTDVNWSSYEDDRPIYELMTRVRIKLWEEGQRTDGIVQENGLLYPIMRGTVYVKWSDNGKYISGIIGHPEDLSYDVADQISESGTIPTDLTVIDYDNAGIDPYKFLNL